MIATIRNAINMATTDISIISNNLANSNSTGFKKSDGNFLHSYAEEVSRPGLNVGFGVVYEEPRRQDHRQGAMRVTNNSLDVAVNGGGMFMTYNPKDDTTAYTRDGSFLLDINGNLITTDGRRVLNHQFEAIVIPPTKIDAFGKDTLVETIAIRDNGRIQITYGDGTNNEVGQFGLARFANHAGLKPSGGGFFKDTAKSGPPIVGVPVQDNFGQLVQGHLEASNTDVTAELSKLMIAQQAFSGSSRLLQAAADVTKRLIG